jgi:hypothetical protein
VSQPARQARGMERCQIIGRLCWSIFECSAGCQLFYGKKGPKFKPRGRDDVPVGQNAGGEPEL